MRPHPSGAGHGRRLAGGLRSRGYARAVRAGLALTGALSLSVAATAGVAGAKTKTSAKSTPLVVGWNSNPTPAYLPVLMGIAALKKQGYTIQTQTLNGAANMAEALASNRAQFSYDNVIGIVKAVTGGAGMKLIYDVGGNTVVWAVKKTFKDCSKLTGQPVGIFGPPTSSAYTNEMEHYFSLKCPGTSPNLVTIPTSTLRVQALLNGQIVGTALSTGPAGVLFQKAPKGEFVTVAMSKLIPGVADNYLIANQQVLKSDPKAVKALVKACLAAAHHIYAGSKAHFLALVKKYSPAGSYTKTSALTLYTQKIFYADGGLKESGFTTNLTKTLTLFHLTGSPSALATSKILKSVSGK